MLAERLLQEAVCIFFTGFGVNDMNAWCSLVILFMWDSWGWQVGEGTAWKWGAGVELISSAVVTYLPCQMLLFCLVYLGSGLMDSGAPLKNRWRRSFIRFHLCFAVQLSPQALILWWYANSSLLPTNPIPSPPSQQRKTNNGRKWMLWWIDPAELPTNSSWFCRKFPEN